MKIKGLNIKGVNIKGLNAKGLNAKGMCIVLIFILGVIFFKQLFTIREGKDLDPDKAKALGEDIKNTVEKKLVDAGVPHTMPDISVIFSQLNEIIKTETNYRREHINASIEAAKLSDTAAKNTVVPEIVNNSFFMGNKFSDAFCDKYDGTSLLSEKCATLTSDNCNLTDCCVYVNGNKCMAGNKQGPRNITDVDYYLYKYQCNGNCNSIPKATSCHGWDCSIEKQRCLSGTPGASTSNWTCINRKWVAD